MDLRGGKHQRASKRSRAEVELAHAYDEPAIHLPTSAHAFDSAIAFELVKGWAWGSHSATDVQRLAHLVHKDFSSVLAKALHIPTGWIPESITKLAKLGSWGKHLGNIHRFEDTAGRPICAGSSLRACSNQHLQSARRHRQHSHSTVACTSAP